MRSTRDEDPAHAYKWKHVQVDGQIIGKPGRRQRQQYKSLPLPSLGQPAHVVLMQDVIETPAPALDQTNVPAETDKDVEENGGDSLSAQEIEAAIKGEHLNPDQEIVNASIEAIRPPDTLLDGSGYDELVQKMLQSYNARQLVSYLVQTGSQTRRTSKRAGNKYDTLWTPGNTSLQQRPGTIKIKKDSTGNSKRRIVEQILRIAWRVQVPSESQQVGELELNFGDSPWQMDRLFRSQSEDGTIMYQKYLGSQLLVRATRIVPYWPNNVVRITGRRHDAEEAARQLRSRLSVNSLLEVDLERFGASFKYVPWESTMQVPMRESDMRIIARLTGTTITQSDMTLRIYSEDMTSRFNAKRLAISLLDLPSPKTTRVLDEDTRGLETPTKELLKAVREDANMMEYPAAGIHQRLRESVLYRSQKPVPVNRKDGPQPNSVIQEQSRWQELSRWLKDQYEQGTTDNVLTDNSYWKIGSRHLTASYCHLLQLSVTRQGRGRSSSNRFIQHHQPPGLMQLLSCFEPYTKKTSNLTVRLMPEVARRTAQSTLPRVFFTMAVNPGTLNPVPVSQYPAAAVSVHENIVPLPAFAVDTVFTSAQSITSKTFSEDPRFKDYVKHIQESVTNGSGFLSGQPWLEIPMPAVYVVPPSTLSRGSKPDVVDVSYVLEQFEQVQRMRFVPKAMERLDPRLSPDARIMLAAWPQNAVLEVLMVDAGGFGGRKTEVRLVQANRLPFKESLQKFQQKVTEDTTSERNLLDFIEGAFLVPKLLTMATNGTLYEDGKIIRTVDHALHRPD